MKTVLIISDTTEKQTNGVVRTLNEVKKYLSKRYTVVFITPELFKSVSFPFYKEVDISVDTFRIGAKIEEINPDFIHIATEGPVGLSGKLYCDKKKYKYTTSYHSMFPEFIQEMYKIPSFLTYPYFKWFHKKSSNVLVPTNKMKNQLEENGFDGIVIWGRGVDRRVFNSKSRGNPIISDAIVVLCVSRISKEKGLDDFCEIKLPHNYIKILVGDGPYLKELKKKNLAESVIFPGKKYGKDLSYYYANADVFIFPSRNDTFGLTQLESIASGTPVLAYKDTVSEEIIREGKSGFVVDEFNIENIDKAISLSRKYVEDESYKWTWKKSVEIFEKYLVPK